MGIIKVQKRGVESTATTELQAVNLNNPLIILSYHSHIKVVMFSKDGRQILYSS